MPVRPGLFILKVGNYVTLPVHHGFVAYLCDFGRVHFFIVGADLGVHKIRAFKEFGIRHAGHEASYADTAIL